MAFQERREGESFDSMFKKFKRNVKREGTLQDLRNREYFQKPSDEKKLKKKAAERRTRIEQQADELF